MSVFENRKELQAADPSRDVEENSPGSVPNFARIVHDARRKRFLGAGAVVGVLAIPVAIAAFAFGGRSSSTVEFADLSSKVELDDVKGGKKKPKPTAQTAPAIQKIKFLGVPSLELGATAG